MRQKLDIQKKNIDSNTPRIAVGLTALISLPSFYYMYQMLLSRYEWREFLNNVKLQVDWMNLRLAVECGLMFGLQALHFKDARASKVIPTNSKFFFYCLPLVIGFASLSYVNSVNHWWMVSTLANLGITTLILSNVVNMGGLPFWKFNLIYTIHALDVFVLIILFFAMRRFNQHREDKPYLYL